MSILITGGAGFIGSSIADKLLQTGEKIIVLDNFDTFYSVEFKENNIKHNLKNRNYQLYRTDICDKSKIEEIFETNKISSVIHLAALAGVRTSFENPQNFYYVNVIGTKCILDCVKKYKIKKFVFASSSSVYGNCTKEKFKEDEPNLIQISPYAKTKYECEKIIQDYTLTCELNAICLRLFTVYGPRQRPDLAIIKFINLIKNDKPLPLYGDGTMSRDYTYIDDITEGFISALHYDKTNFEIINIGSGSPVSLLEMINIIEDALGGKKAKIEYLPNQKGDVKKTHADISKAKKLLDYTPHTPFRLGIKKFIEVLNKYNQ